MRFLPLLLIGLLAVLSTGCLWQKKPKNASHIYGGEAPTIKYQEKQDRAGGRLSTY